MKTATTQARVEEVQRGGIEKPQQADYLAALAELKATVFARLQEELSATRTAHGTGA